MRVIEPVNTRVRRKDCGERFQQWIRENYGDRDIAASAQARELRKLNQARFVAAQQRAQPAPRRSYETPLDFEDEAIPLPLAD